MSIEVPISIPKTLIIIPAYNEEEAIADTLTRLLELKQHFTALSICVINDGSQDKTAQIVKISQFILLIYHIIWASVQLYKLVINTHMRMDMILQFSSMLMDNIIRMIYTKLYSLSLNTNVIWCWVHALQKNSLQR